MKRHTAAVVQNMTFHDSARLDLVTYEDRISIPTPEGVELELVLAGVGSRLVATVIDYLVKGAILLALWIIGTAVGGDEVGGFLLAGLVVASFLVWFGYDVAFETLASGRTPGKRAAGLRVVRLGGEPVGFLASAVRNLLRLVDSLPGLYAVGALSVLFSRRNQRLGDLAAVLQVAAHRQPAGDPRHPHPERLQQPGQVHGRGLAFDVGVGGQDHLLHALVGQPAEQLPDAELLGADALDGGDGPAEHVVEPPELPGSFDGHDVAGVLPAADQRRGAGAVAAEAARLT